MATILHWLFGCRGFVDHEVDENGVNWIGLRCVHCGKLKSPSVSAVQDTEAGRTVLSNQGGSDRG